MLAASLGLASPAVAQTRAGPQITFRVYDFAQVAPGVLTEAEQQTAMIFTRAGVDTAWVDCPCSPQESQRYPACFADLGSTDVAVKILNWRMFKGLGPLPAADTALGFAVPITREEQLGLVYVFYPRIEGFAQEGGVPVGQILGEVIAHEVGHLLLGPHAHAAGGVMLAHWSMRELTLAAQSDLAFVPQQAQSLRAELAARSRFRRFSAPGK